MFFPNRNELCKYVAEVDNKETVLSFSCGKDSIGAYLELRKHFDKIHLFYYYLVPGLEFVENNVQYYEKVFNTHIIRVPNPYFYRMLREMVFQPPTNVFNLLNMNLPKYDWTDLEHWVKTDLQLKTDMYVATGVRMSDSLARMVHFKQHGCLSESKRKYYPIWDITAKELYKSFKDNNIKLPRDYELWGRTFDGIDYKFLSVIKKEYPKDFERIQEFFPMIELELLRYQQ